MQALVPAMRQAASVHLLMVKILRLPLLEEEIRGLLVPLLNGVPLLQQRQSVEEVKTAGRMLPCASFMVHFNSYPEGLSYGWG